MRSVPEAARIEPVRATCSKYRSARRMLRMVLPKLERRAAILAMDSNTTRS
jgi:hypothetical protein